MASSSSSVPRSLKRKGTVVLLETKKAILDRIQKGETQAQLASEYGIGKSTLFNVKKNEEKIQNFATMMDSLAMSKKRKVMRPADDDRLDQTLYLWFVQKRSQNVPVSGPVVCEKAVTMHAQIHAGESVPPFKDSRGWLWHFCNRHGVTQLSLQGEKLSSDTTALEPYKEQLQELVERESLMLENLYNCDETGLYYQMLPDKTRAEKEAAGMKKQEHVTLTLSRARLFLSIFTG